jgi:hypothetical protein
MGPPVFGGVLFSLDGGEAELSTNGPNMIGQSGSHRRRPLLPPTPLVPSPFSLLSPFPFPADRPGRATDADSRVRAMKVESRCGAVAEIGDLAPLN